MWGGSVCGCDDEEDDTEESGGGEGEVWRSPRSKSSTVIILLDRGCFGEEGI